MRRLFNLILGGTLALIYSISTVGAEDRVKREPQRTTHIAMIGEEPIEVHVWRPRSCVARSLLIVFPGISRDSLSYLKRARKIAREHCMTVVAPTLDRERFPRARYQRAGVARRDVDGAGERCMGLFVRRLITWARENEGRKDAGFVLFGHSAGAQMLGRVAAYCPTVGADRIVLANPSAYVSASLVELAPYGFAGIADVGERERRLQSYLAQPLTIYLGTADVGDRNLDDHAAANRQGRNRFQRGLKVFELARETAKARGWAFNWRLVTAPGIGHSSRRMLRAAQMSEALAKADIPR